VSKLSFVEYARLFALWVVAPYAVSIFVAGVSYGDRFFVDIESDVVYVYVHGFIVLLLYCLLVMLTPPTCEFCALGMSPRETR